jgi:hypothetical protein
MRNNESGLLIHDQTRATPGYTLYAPVRGEAAYLIDMEGKEVHQWPISDPSVNLVALLDNGNLLSIQTCGIDPPLPAGAAGALRELDPSGKIVWEHVDPLQHHDARRLANGNTLYIAWYPLSDDAMSRVLGGQAGTEAPGNKIYGDSLKEVTRDGDLVWEWKVEEGIDLGEFPISPLAMRTEFTHANTCAPLDNGDVLMTFRVLNTIALVERATGRVKWHRRDDRWGGPHDSKILANGNVLMFANGWHSTHVFDYSRVIELDPQTGDHVWTYEGDPPMSFYSQHISGAQRLANGNTLICEGATGRLFEVTPEKEIVWQYVNPHLANQEATRMGWDRWVFRATRYAPDAPGILALNL